MLEELIVRTSLLLPSTAIARSSIPPQFGHLFLAKAALTFAEQ